MAFVEPITIKDAVHSIHSKDYLLPAIQREFVWDVCQIEKLFDSLMQDYPISSFLFWELDSTSVNNYQFYEFIRDYHERDNTHNPKANINGSHGVTAILDGQQRLTSLYIALKGSYTYKLPRKRWENDSAFPKRSLYLNLIAPSQDSDLEYDFKFLTEEESKFIDSTHFWFRVGNILNFHEAVDVNDYLVERDIASLGREEFRFANKSLFKLYEVIHKNKSINFFLERDDSLNKVLNIFIRVNSGGTQLSYSDLLLSVATAQWKEKDAREEITYCVDEINAIGDGFNINKDFVLKSCLVLSGIKDISFNVDNFNKKNMLIIEHQWENIAKAIRSAVNLVSSFGYQRYTLTSNNALIPIALYLQKINIPDNFIYSSHYEKDRKKIFRWLAIVLIKRTFSNHSDNALRIIRDIVHISENGFPVEAIKKELKGTSKTISFDDDEIDNLFHYQYGQSYTYSILTLIYPNLDFRNKFHQDHIFPKHLFTRRALEKQGIEDEKIELYLRNFNGIANLQLLEGIPNQEKSGKEFNLWLKEKYPDDYSREVYMENNYIPNVDLSIENFMDFIDKRKHLITSFIKNLLSF